MRDERLGRWVLYISSVSLALSRWGSWLGIPGTSVFFIDLILVTLFMLSLNSHFPMADNFRFLALAIYVLAEFIGSSNYSAFIRLRDLAPFLYFMLFIKFRNQIQLISHSTLSNCLRVGTLISLIWSLGSSLGVLAEFTIGGFTGAPVFSIRADQFGFVAAVGIISWSQLHIDSLWKRNAKFVIILLFLVEVALLPGRAGALASIIGIIYLIFSPSNGSRDNRRIGVFLLTAVITLVTASSVLNDILPEQSSLKRSGLVSGTEIAQASGSNTASARKIAQKRLIVWIGENNLEVFGAGPGREMLIESGAYRWLSGSVDVRQPHNWWISLYARFGLLGTSLWVGITWSYWRPIKRRFLAESKNYFLTSILISSTFSVILEAPFGLIPFYFLLMTPTKGTSNSHDRKEL